MTGQISQREKIEWLNYWIEEANSEKNRILLIGDSTTRQYRKTLNDILSRRGYVVDLVATSYSMTDPLLYEELSHFINVVKYSYEIIVFQLGAHHGYCIECKNSIKDRELYEFHLRKILKMLAKENVKLVTAAGTPEREIDLLGNQMEHHNDEICERNQILKEVSRQEKYLFIDLYQDMIEHRYEQVDLFHYVRGCDEYIANRIAEVLFCRPIREIYNELDTVEEFENVLKSYKEIYIYGQGKRGGILEKYLMLKDKKVNGYIVSDKFYNMAKNAYLLSDLEINKDALIIVTPKEYDIYSLLNSREYSYISLTDELYMYLEEIANKWRKGMV